MSEYSGDSVIVNATAPKAVDLERGEHEALMWTEAAHRRPTRGLGLRLSRKIGKPRGVIWELGTRAAVSLLLTGLLLSISAPRDIAYIPKASASTLAPVDDVVRHRKNVEALSSDELENLKHAFDVVIKLGKKNENDPKGYAYWARIHNSGVLGPCIHRNDLFLPWHRAHLADFEKVLQASDPDGTNVPAGQAPRPTRNVTLAYWDWTQRTSGERGYPKCLEDTTSPLYFPGRKGYPRGTIPYPSPDKDLLNLPWKGFGTSQDGRGSGQLESGPHNPMHGTYIGGVMARETTAAQDPIYWFLHTNIDRLYDEWQAKHQGDQCADTPDPSKITCQGQAGYTCPIGGTGSGAGNSKWPDQSRKVKSMLCTKQLGYDYLEEEALAKSPPAAALDRFLTAEQGTPVNYPFKIPSGTFETATLLLTDDVQPTGFSYVARIYLHPASARYHLGNKQYAEKYSAGFYGEWGLPAGEHEGGGHHAMPASISVDLSAKFKELAQAHPDENWTLTIVFTRAGKTQPLHIGRDVRYSKASLIFGDGGAPQEVTLTSH
jgi:hypothetical protein